MYVFSFIIMALQVYKGCYYKTFVYAFYAFDMTMHAWNSLMMVWGQWNPTRVILWISWILAFCAMGTCLGAACELHKWDQVTLWDGVVMRGVEVWDTNLLSRKPCSRFMCCIAKAWWNA
jgi:hypothetical protein